MPRDDNTPFARLFAMSNGDMDTMRRIEQFGPDILKQYGAPQASPDMMLPAGNPMARLPTAVDPSAYMELPPTMDEGGRTQAAPQYNDEMWPYEGLPPYAQPIVPTGGRNKSVGNAAGLDATMSQPAVPSPKGGPVTKGQMASFDGNQYNMLDALLDAEAGPMQGSKSIGFSQPDPAADSKMDALLAAGGIGTTAAMGYGVHKGISGGQPQAKKPNKVDSLDLRTQGGEVQGPPMSPASQFEPDSYKAIDNPLSPADKFIQQSNADQQIEQYARGAQGLDANTPGDPVTIARDRFQEKLAAQGWAPDQIRRTVGKYEKVLRSGDEAAIARLLTKADPEIFDAFFGAAEATRAGGVNDKGLEKLLKARNMIKALRF